MENTRIPALGRRVSALLMAVLLAVAMMVAGLFASAAMNPSSQDSYSTGYLVKSSSDEDSSMSWQDGGYQGEYIDWGEYLIDWWASNLGFEVSNRAKYSMDGHYVEICDGIIVIDDFCYVPADEANPHAIYTKYERIGTYSSELGAVSVEEDETLAEAVKIVDAANGLLKTIGLVAVIVFLVIVGAIVAIIIVMRRKSKKDKQEFDQMFQGQLQGQPQGYPQIQQPYQQQQPQPYQPQPYKQTQAIRQPQQQPYQQQNQVRQQRPQQPYQQPQQQYGQPRQPQRPQQPYQQQPNNGYNQPGN